MLIGWKFFIPFDSEQQSLMPPRASLLFVYEGTRWTFDRERSWLYRSPGANTRTLNREWDDTRADRTG